MVAMQVEAVTNSAIKFYAAEKLGICSLSYSAGCSVFTHEPSALVLDPSGAVTIFMSLC